MANNIILNFMANLNHNGPVDTIEYIINLCIDNGLVSKVDGEIFMTYVNANRNPENFGLGGGTIEGYIRFATASTVKH